MYGYIYKTTNLINGKQYIGQHQATKFEPEKYKGSGTYLKRAFKKYGKENFVCELLETCDSLEELNLKEEYWICVFNAVLSEMFYNIAAGGSNCSKTDEQRKHLSEAWTVERRKRLGDRVRGNNNPSKRPEVRLKMSVNNTSRLPEYREKISAGKKGKPLPHTDEWNANISKALKGRKISVFSEITRKKISDSKKGSNNPMYGKSAVIGTKWFNNGIINIRAVDCPEGFTVGRIKHKDE